MTEQDASVHQNLLILVQQSVPLAGLKREICVLNTTAELFLFLLCKNYTSPAMYHHRLITATGK